jgi:hypothetical protein
MKNSLEYLDIHRERGEMNYVRTITPPIQFQMIQRLLI